MQYTTISAKSTTLSPSTRAEGINDGTAQASVPAPDRRRWRPELEPALRALLDHVAVELAMESVETLTARLRAEQEEAS